MLSRSGFIARSAALILLGACVGFAPVAAPARLGETLDELKLRMGKPAPQKQARKDQAVWLFEAQDGELIYNVTFDAQGRSIAEGLRPLKRAIFTEDIALDFIHLQLEPYRGSKTLRLVKPGESYQFAGQTLVCAEKEVVYVDDAVGLMVVWIQSGVPSVMAVAPAMMQKTL